MYCGLETNCIYEQTCYVLYDYLYWRALNIQCICFFFFWLGYAMDPSVDTLGNEKIVGDVTKAEDTKGIFYFWTNMYL